MIKGKQILSWKRSCGKACEHCLYSNHGSNFCPLLYCRVCKSYGHSAVVCDQKEKNPACERKKVPASPGGLAETHKTYLEQQIPADPIG